MADVLLLIFFFFFNDTATTEIYTLSLHDALPILPVRTVAVVGLVQPNVGFREKWNKAYQDSIMADLLALARQLEDSRSEEHTSELQSQSNLVCRLLLEKKKKAALYAIPR